MVECDKSRHISESQLIYELVDVSSQYQSCAAALHCQKVFSIW